MLYMSVLPFIIIYVILQPLFKVSGQQQSIRVFTEGEYKQLRGKFDKNGVRKFILLISCYGRVVIILKF